MSLAPPKPSQQLVPGYRLDRYELLCPIAQGGMASVWVARLIGKHGFEKLVAIKTILPQYAQDLRFQKMFLDEAHIASGIEHTNVAQILDLGEEHDVLYIVMEFVDGDALSKAHRAVVKKGGFFPHGVLLRICADALAGLHAAHELRDKEGTELHVVHRDVSPQNILVSNKGVSKVIDFGIAKARDRVAGETGTGLLKGKIQYMPPEQALGRMVDRRADIWAIGAILYHYLAGRAPYDAENQLATLHMLTSGKPPLPLPQVIPAPITRIVRKAMAFDKANRWSSALEMQKAIEDAMIECGMATSTADVQQFLAKELRDRQEHRRQAIDLALKAAAERARMQQLLKPMPNTLTGVDGKSLAPPPIPVDLTAAVQAVHAANLPSLPPPSRVEVGTPSPSPSIGAISETTGATLGSAAVETSVQPSSIMPSGSRRKRVAAAIAAFGLAAAIGVIVLAAGASKKTDKRDARPAAATTTAKRVDDEASDVAKNEAAATTASAEPDTSSAPSAASEAPSATAPSSSATVIATVSATAVVVAPKPYPYPTAYPKPFPKPATTTTTTATAVATATAPKPASTKVDDGF